MLTALHNASRFVGGGVGDGGVASGGRRLSPVSKLADGAYEECGCDHLEYYTTGSVAAIQAANPPAARCLGFYTKRGVDRNGQALLAHT